MGVEKGTLLPEEMWKLLDSLAEELGVTRSEVVRRAMAYFRMRVFLDPGYYGAFRRRVAEYEKELRGARLRAGGFRISERDNEMLGIMAVRLRKPIYVVVYAVLRESLPGLEAGKEILKKAPAGEG